MAIPLRDIHNPKKNFKVLLLWSKYLLLAGRREQESEVARQALQHMEVSMATGMEIELLTKMESVLEEVLAKAMGSQGGERYFQ